MTPDLQASRPKTKLSLAAMILLGILSLVGLFLLMPSAKVKRITTARKRLAMDYPVVSEEKMKPLLRSHLLIEGTFVYDVQTRKECAIFIFPPDGPTSQAGDSMMYELTGHSVAPWNSMHTVQIATLLAPKESSNGWTIFAKIWIAKALQKQPVKDLTSLGTELSSNPKVLVRLKTIWRKLPDKVKVRATEVLQENRAVAKLYEPTPRFFRNSKTYAIHQSMDLNEFFYTYVEAYPDSDFRMGR